MTAEMIFVFCVLLITIVVFVVDKLRMDLVALLVVVTLAASGIITPADAVSGFGSSLILMIAGLFVVGQGMMQTGIAAATGNWISKVGGDSELRLLLVLLPIAALLSAFMSSTGTVALLIPVVMTIASRAEMNPAKLLMPLAFAASVGGLLTLIGTPPNIVVSDALNNTGKGSFKFFDFTLIGGIILMVSMVYLLTLGRWLLPERKDKKQSGARVSLARLTERYANPHHHLYKLHVPSGSLAVGKTVLELRLRRRFEAALFAIERQSAVVSTFMPVLLNTQVESGDMIWVQGDDRYIDDLCDALQLEKLDYSLSQRVRLQRSFGMAEVVIPPDTDYEGQTLYKARFRERYGLNVIGVIRGQKTLDMRYFDTELQAGDMLLLTGAWEHIRRLGDKADLVVLNTPAELDEIPINPRKAPIALVIMASLLVVMAFGWLANMTAILIAALAMVLTGCLNLNEAYKSLNAKSLVLIAGMLPMALAMERSGAMGYVVTHLVDHFQDAGPLALSAAVFALTATLSLFISNTATAVLIAPVALSMAVSLGYQPEPFMIMVAVAASTAFATPIATPINALVTEVGGYRFSDFIRVGLPLQLVILGLSLWIVPLVFPF